MINFLYGVDLTKEITPLMVRDALVTCFYKAHCEDSGLQSQDQKINEAYCVELVKKAFLDAGENFDQPTKEGLIKAMENLASFAKNFRNQEIIKKHQQEITTLVNKLP